MANTVACQRNAVLESIRVDGSVFFAQDGDADLPAGGIGIYVQVRVDQTERFCDKRTRIAAGVQRKEPIQAQRTKSDRSHMRAAAMVGRPAAVVHPQLIADTNWPKHARAVVRVIPGDLRIERVDACLRTPRR